MKKQKKHKKHIKCWTVLWEIDVEAYSRHEAAQRAREIQLDPESTATLFEVQPHTNFEAKPMTAYVDVDVRGVVRSRRRS